MPVVWPLVGRQEVLQRIAKAMRLPGCAGVVLVGAAGVGKSRLAVEALDEARRRGLDTMWTVATEAAASIPYGSVVDLLLQPEQKFPDEVPLTRSGLLQRIIRSVGERYRGRGLVLGVDDAHLLDDASAALVHCLARTGTAQILATARSGEQSSDAVTALWKDGLAARVEIKPLGEDEARQLICAAVGGTIDGQTLRRLWRLSAGNLLFLRELVVDALETGALVEVDGIWGGGPTTMVGARLTELVEVRFRRLDPLVRAGLEVIAVGEPLEASLLEAFLSVSMPTSVRVTDAGWMHESPMEIAERAGLLSVDVDRRRLRLRLAHPVYGEVLRATMPVLRARAIRRGLADALQATGCRRRDDPLRLALWQLEGGGPSNPDLLLTAASRARALLNPALAARLAQAAGEAGAGFEASLIAAESLQTAGCAHDAEDLLSELEAAAPTKADRARVALARASNLLTGFGRAGEAEAVVGCAESAVADKGLRDELRAMRGTIAFAQGRSQEALNAVLAVLDRPDASQRARMRALLVAVPVWTQAGATETAISTAEQTITALGRSDEQPEVIELLRLGLCFAYGFVGRFDDAYTMATARYRVSLDHLTYDLQIGWAITLGQVTLAMGSARSAAERLREAASLLRRESTAFGVYSLAWCLGCLAEAMALLGDLDAAQAALREADAVIPEQCFVPNREVGRIWVAACGGAVAAAQTTALRMAATARAHGSYAVEAFALHEAVRLGLVGKVADRLRVLADGIVDGRLMSAYAAHAMARVAGEAPALQNVSATFEELGAILIAAEAAAETAHAHQRAGRAASAYAAGGRSRSLLERCEGCRTPRLERLILPQPLTVREREIVGLAAQGLSSQHIAERLMLSVRTVDNHLHHAYAKLGVSSRTELATVLSLREG